MPEAFENQNRDHPEQPSARRSFLGFKIIPLRGARDLWQLPLLLVGAALAALGAAIWIGSSPGPDFDGALDDAEVLISRQRYDRALDILNGPILDELSKPGVDDQMRGRLHGLRGDALYLSMHRRLDEYPSSVRHVNHEKVLDEFHEAEQYDEGQITPRRHTFIAEALLDLDSADKAMHHIESLPESMASRRLEFQKRIVDRYLSTPEGNGAEQASEMLAHMRIDLGPNASDRLWILAKQTEIRLAQGLVERALEELLPEVHRLERRDTAEAGELFLLLGRAYMEQGQFDRARDHLHRAEQVFLPGDERRGEVETKLARIAQTDGELEEARDRYSSVIERFPGTGVEALALLGLGEVESDLGRYDESLEAFARLVEVLPEVADVRGVTPELVDLSMSQRHRARLLSGDLEVGLSLAELIERAYLPDRAPPDAIERLAETHRALADHLLGSNEKREVRPTDVLRADLGTREAARLHYEHAGEYFQQHLTRVMVQEPELASRSMWNAADAFDRAGDQRRSIELFTEFMQAMQADPAALEAKFRLARAFQAGGEHQTAIVLFEEIIEENPQSDEAYQSYVPLARSHLLRGESSDAVDAERWLIQVMSGRLFEPSADQFQLALIDLGRLYLSQGRYAEAIARLRETLDRYPDRPDRAHVEFDLGDALRLSAVKIERQLMDAMPASDRAMLESLRLERLEQGRTRYEHVRMEIAETSPADRTALDRELHRNASFFRADCAYDLGQFDEAIRQYDAAAQRFAGEPASLVAMVQIVNCYVALERWREAQTAHARAQQRLREVPEEVWGSGSIPMDRRHWEQWLESSIRIDQMSARVDVGDDAER